MCVNTRNEIFTTKDVHGLNTNIIYSKILILKSDIGYAHKDSSQHRTYKT